MVIVCDDTRTAPAYFTELKREIKQYVTLKVNRAPCQGASPNVLVDHARNEQESLKTDRDDDDKDAVWVLLDLEGGPEQCAQTQQTKKLAKQEGISVALSIPCYEVWTLLHLEDTGTQFNDCNQVLDRVRQLWKERFEQEFGPKARADYSKIIKRRHDAVTRAESHWINRDPTRTEVFKVIQQIDSYLKI